jgi:hypothetical protein
MDTSKTVIAEFRTNSSIDYNLAVSVSGNGTVTSTPLGIDCGGDCIESYSRNTFVSLNAAAANGYVFNGWGGDCPNDAGSIASGVTMNSDKNCTATFGLATTNSLAVSITGGGDVTSLPAGIDCGTDCLEDFQTGTFVELTAVPNSPYLFSAWSGDCNGTTTQTSLTVNSDLSCDATFVLPTVPVTMTLNIGAGPGSIYEPIAGLICTHPGGGVTTCSATYNAGTNLVLEVSTSAGTDWTQGCDNLILVDAAQLIYHCALQINSDRTVAVDFR